MIILYMYSAISY